MYNILFVQPYASRVGGVDAVLLQLVQGLDRSRYRAFVLLPSPSPYAEQYAKAGATVLYGPLAVFGKPTDALYYFRNLSRLFRSLFAIRRYVKQHRIDLIHSHKMETIGPNLIGRLLGIPTVQTVHELARRPLIAYRCIAWLNHLLNDKVIVLCERSKLMFQWIGWKSRKLVKIYNGISEKAAIEKEAGVQTLREQLNLKAQDKVAIAIARLTPMKGLDYLIEAAARWRAEHPEIKVVIAGDVAFEHEKPYKEQLLKQLAEAGLQETVYMIGLRRDVPALLAQCDMLVLPSVYDIFPTVILEAMRAGLPIVATDVGGVPEMVRQDCGVLVPPKQAKALAEAVVGTFAADYRAMGRRAHAWFQLEFTDQQYIRQTTALYSQLLADRAAAR